MKGANMRNRFSISIRWITLVLTGILHLIQWGRSNKKPGAWNFNVIQGIG